MHLSMLEWLRCPFCGMRLAIAEESPSVRAGEELEAGVLWCECCAYPVIDGIPVLLPDATTRSALHQFEAGDGDQARLTLLGLEGDRARAFEVLRSTPEQMTYRSAIEVLSPDPEGTYFVYRFSDPTFMMASALLQAIAPVTVPPGGRALDLCGGSGHLTRVLTASLPAAQVVLTDKFYFKIWLARTFTAPACAPVCCDANSSLPWASDTFGLVVLADAFPYIWHKWRLAAEMVRLAGDAGALVIPHLHSSLGYNFSAGMPLTPASSRNLFDKLQPRLFSDTRLLDDVLEGASVDLTAALTPEELGDAPSFTLVASRNAALFRRYNAPPPGKVIGELRVNPLYRVDVVNGQSRLTLTFPTDGYEEEFGECQRYLPATVTLPGDVRKGVSVSSLGSDAEQLRRRRVIVDFPPRYY